MDGKRIREYWSQEVNSLLVTYKQFETLLPSKNSIGSSHNPEDGRYVEELVKEVLRKFLPKELEIFSGFVLRPAVKTWDRQLSRKEEEDVHSSQLDLIIYDSAKYPIFKRFGDTCIVPPEGVIAVISIKKTLRSDNIIHECQALQDVSKLCAIKGRKKRILRGPFLALIGMEADIKKGKTVFKKMQKAYDIENELPTFDSLIGYIGAFKSWSIFKAKPNKNWNKAKYVKFNHKKEKEHLGLQFLLTGILSVYYDKSRNATSRPGFTSFPNDAFDTPVGTIGCNGES